MQVLAAKGLQKDEYLNRLEYELRVIHEHEFEAVFIISHRLIKRAKENGIRVGVGRGSAAGSLVCYLLGITGLDPIVHSLQFERFLIRGRTSPPDIDIDFEKSRRDEVYGYLEDLIGADRVVKISTFIYMKMRSVLRDVARVLEIPLKDVNIIISQIPKEVENINDLFNVPSISRWIAKYPELFKYAGRLEGKPRHTSIHAAGAIISNEPVRNIMPLHYNVGKKAIATAWDMYDCDQLGLIKLDILGLITLDVMSETIKLGNIKQDIDKLELNDENIIRRFADGDTKAVFQLERDYVQDLLRLTKVDRFEDLAVINALLRPGALSANAPSEYAERKHGKQYDLIDSDLEPILGSTYGLLVFQEQAMQIARDIAGFSIQEADKLRKAIAKLHAGKMSKFKDDFFNGAEERRYPHRKVEKIWALLEGAGAYMFNKAHSTCYSYIAYQTMWLKTYYPTEFWSAMLNSKLTDETKLYDYGRFIKRNGFELLKPSVQNSKAKFFPVADHAIRAGFLCVKGIGPKVAQQLETLEERESLNDWIKSLDKLGRRTINKSTIKKLLDAGAFACYNLPHDEIEDALTTRAKKKPTRAPKKKKSEPKRKRLEETYLFGEPDEYKEI